MPVRLAAMPVRLAAMPVRLAAMPVRLAAIPVRLAAMPVRLAAMPVRGAAMPVRLAAMPVRLAAMPVRDAAMPVRDAAPGSRPVSGVWRAFAEHLPDSGIGTPFAKRSPGVPAPVRRCSRLTRPPDAARSGTMGPSPLVQYLDSMEARY
jgi:hypothetical protein